MVGGGEAIGSEGGVNAPLETTRERCVFRCDMPCHNVPSPACGGGIGRGQANEIDDG
jgi:hypothetical protein